MSDRDLEAEARIGEEVKILLNASDHFDHQTCEQLESDNWREEPLVWTGARAFPYRAGFSRLLCFGHGEGPCIFSPRCGYILKR